MEQKTVILAIETSGRTGSVAVFENDVLLSERFFSSMMKHSAELLPTATALLLENNYKPLDVKHIYISIGPGSYTGLRIAATVAKIMSLAIDCKIVTVDTLDVIAANIYGQKNYSDIDCVGSVLDAKRGQFYISIYDKIPDNKISNGNDYSWQKNASGLVVTAGDFVKQCNNTGKPILLTGEGLVYYADDFKSDLIQIADESLWYPKASTVGKLGWLLAQNNVFSDALTLEPSYLRKPDAKKKTN